jgi:hypothetical protein
VAVFGLYCRTPFGRLHHRNPDIQELARHIGRSASAVAMKACNFAALDPALRARVRGLANVSRADRDLWLEFARFPERIALEAGSALARSTASLAPDEQLEPWQLPSGPTEVWRPVRARRVQAFFRAAVLSSYNFRCALTGIAEPELLNASHIVPWREDAARRADPCNGICLNALHDRAFDRGWLSFDESLRTLVSPKLRKSALGEFGRRALLEMEGRPLTLPDRFRPDPAALRWHRENRFLR